MKRGLEIPRVYILKKEQNANAEKQKRKIWKGWVKNEEKSDE